MPENRLKFFHPKCCEIKVWNFRDWKTTAVKQLANIK